jgi:hypothetical protein
MGFEEFVRHVDAAVRNAVSIDRFDEPAANKAAWKRRSQNAVIAAVPPGNVSLTLSGPRESDATTWYPIDDALVPVVSGRIARYLIHEK